MPSNTQKTRKRRKRHNQNQGRSYKKAREKQGTPKFPIHPESDGKKSAADKK